MSGGRPSVPGVPARSAGPRRPRRDGGGTTRRALLVRAGRFGVAAATPAWAWSPALGATTGVDVAVRELLTGRGFAESPGFRLDLPERFESGNTVPLAVALDSPMTGADHVRRVTLLAEGNPFPEVANLHFTPGNGRTSASTRIRLNEGRQQVVAVAELSDGRVWLARRTVEVAVSGCSAESGVAVGEAMPLPEPRLKLPAQARRDEIVEVRTMISHRMETGLRVDAAGRPIPRRIINRMVCTRDGEPVFAADLTPAVAANAYLGFTLVARESAVLTFAWREDGGGEYRATRPLTVV
jgi:sulfur-oxidizing protein SoxY